MSRFPSESNHFASNQFCVFGDNNFALPKVQNGFLSRSIFALELKFRAVIIASSFLHILIQLMSQKQNYCRLMSLSTLVTPKVISFTRPLQEFIILLVIYIFGCSVCFFLVFRRFSGR